MGSTSKYKGVSWDRKTNKFESSITCKGVKHNCGFYDLEDDAIKARDKRILALGLPVKMLQKLKPLER